MKSSQLNNLLKSWAARNSADDRKLGQLEERISKRLKAEHISPLPRRPAGLPLSPRLVFASLTAAASMLVIGLFLMRPMVDRTTPSDIAALITIQDTERREKQKLFAETARLFQSDLQWIAESDGDIEIGLAGVSARQSSDSGNATSILLKVLLLKRASEGRQMQVLWNGDVLAGSEHIVTIRPQPETPENKLTLWLYPLNDTGVIVDFNLNFGFDARIQASSANHLVGKRPARVLAITRGNYTYEMYLSAATLPEEAEQRATVL